MDHRSRTYQKHLQSPQWRQYRRQVLRRDNYRCTQCGRRGGLDVHHRTYARFGHEALGDCTSLCRACHQHEHGQRVTSGSRGTRHPWLPLLVILLLLIVLLLLRQPR